MKYTKGNKFVGEFWQVSEERYKSEVSSMIMRTFDKAMQSSKFDLDYTQKGLPQDAEFWINFVDNFELPNISDGDWKGTKQLYHEALLNAQEAYELGTEERRYGRVSKKDYKVLKPSWLEEMLHRRVKELDTLDANIRSYRATYEDDWIYMTNGKHYMAKKKKHAAKQQKDYLKKKGAKEFKDMKEKLKDSNASEGMYA